MDAERVNRRTREIVEKFSGDGLLEALGRPERYLKKGASDQAVASAIILRALFMTKRREPLSANRTVETAKRLVAHEIAVNEAAGEGDRRDAAIVDVSSLRKPRR